MLSYRYDFNHNKRKTDTAKKKDTPMDSLKAFAESLQDDQDGIEYKKIYFNVPISAEQAFKLNKLAEQFTRRASGFAGNVLEKAVDDVWAMYHSATLDGKQKKEMMVYAQAHQPKPKKPKRKRVDSDKL